MYDKDYANFIARMGSFEDEIDLGDSEDELKHYGILGMKWGKRKAGVTTTTERRMSNKELNARLKRLRMEQEFEKLSGTTKKTTLEKVETTAKAVGTVATLTTATLTLYKNFNEISKIAKAAASAVK